MPSAPLSLSMEVGEDAVWAGVHQASSVDPTPVNISGWTIAVTCKNLNGTTLFTKSGSVVSGPAGTYTWPVAAADTAGLLAGPREIDIWRTDSGSAREMAKGRLTLNWNPRNGG